MFFTFRRHRPVAQFLLFVILPGIAYAARVANADTSDNETSYIIFHVPVVEGVDDIAGEVEPAYLAVYWWDELAYLKNDLPIQKIPAKKIYLSHIDWCKERRWTRASVGRPKHCPALYFQSRVNEFDVKPGRIYYLGLLSFKPAESAETHFDKKHRWRIHYDYSVNFAYSEELLRSACAEMPEAFVSRPVAFPFFDLSIAETSIDCSRDE